MSDPSQPKLTSLSEIKAWIDRHGFAPSKVLGQNFLIDANIQRIMVEAGDIQPDEGVLEIGPGLGVLTQELVKQARHVVAVEKDQRLADGLLGRLDNPVNITLIQEDALRVDMEELKNKHNLSKLLANLPYSVGSRILVNAFLLNEGFERIAVTVQLEVAERLAAACGTSDFGLLSIWAQLDHEVHIAKRISAGCFYPRPTVTSAIVVMKRRFNRRTMLRDATVFDSLIKHAFSKRRKQIGTILRTYEGASAGIGIESALRTAGIDPSDRPETIGVEQWIALANALQP